MITIEQAVQKYLQSVADSRSERTARSYQNGMNAFLAVLRDQTMDPANTPVDQITEAHILLLIKALKKKAKATEDLYLTAVTGFYHFLAAEQLLSPNLAKLKELIKRRARKGGRRLPEFPRGPIEQLISYAQELSKQSVEQAGSKAKTAAGQLEERKRARLRNLRDRAFILFLADTGLRVDEACSLTFGDVNFLEGHLNVIGKGDQQARVRISERALAALNDYLRERSLTIQVIGEKARSLPLFIRHDRGKGDKVERISTQTGWNLVKARAAECVGKEAAAQIHPHSFRHYFVTVVLLATKNIEVARRLARHKSIRTTQGYAEVDPELDQEYYEIFNANRRKNPADG